MERKTLIPFRKRRLLPFRELTSLHDIIDDFFNEWTRSDAGSLLPFRESGFVTPSVDVSEDKENLYVEADLPGLTEKDIDLSLTRDTLVIRGEKREEREKKEKEFFQHERYYGAFYREVPLFCEVDQNKINAEFKNGVLKITLAKTSEARSEQKKIPIRG